MGDRLREVLKLVRRAAVRWYNDNTFRLGAALAYYTVFSLAPVVLIAISIGGLVFGKEVARRQILQEIHVTTGAQVGKAVESMLDFNEAEGTSGQAAVLSVIILIFAATTVFAQLQDALNTIWGVQPKQNRGLKDIVRDRFLSFTIVLGIGFLLLVSLVVSALLAAISSWLSTSALPGGVYLWKTLDWCVSFGLVTGLFAMIYKILPDVEIEWKEVWVGAIVTSLLFSIGKYLISLYLAQSSWISSYGAAGSLIVVLLWVYYSSQILLFGAEFTYIYAHRHGERLHIKEIAEPLTQEARERQGLQEQVENPATP